MSQGWVSLIHQEERFVAVVQLRETFAPAGGGERARSSAVASKGGQNGRAVAAELRPGGGGWRWARWPILGNHDHSGGVWGVDGIKIPLKAEQG